MTYTPITHGQSNWDVPVNAAFVDQDGRITANTNSITTTNVAVAKVQNGNFDATDQGFSAWSGDPILYTGTSGVLVSGTLYMHKIKVTSSFICSNITYVVHAAGITLTAGQNFMALYDPSGNRIALSADLTATDFASTGTKTTAWVTPVSLSPGVYYAALLCNATTPVNVVKTATFTNAGAMFAGLTAATSRASSGGTGLTALTATPDPVTMANRTSGSNTFWFALN